MAGWIKLHRKLIQTSFYKDSQTVHLAIHLLMKANHREVKVIFNNEEVSINRGSLITGRHALSKEIGIQESTVYRKLRDLEKVGFSHTKSNNKYSIITIINYDSYNYNDKQGEQRIEQPVNNQRTQTRRNKKEENIYSSNSDEFRVAELLFSFIIKRHPNNKVPDFQKWALHIDKMIRLDRRSVEDVKKIIRWCQEDEFWQNNILSTGSLRKQYDTLWLKAGLNGKQNFKRFDEQGF